jgi:hypothetical protein
VALTGRFNFRKTLTGKVVLQLEEDVKAWWPSRKRTKRRWRDANLMDLARPELRPLIDLRQRPNYQAQSYKLEELDLDEATLPMQGGRPAPHDGSGRISAHRSPRGRARPARPPRAEGRAFRERVLFPAR